MSYEYNSDRGYQWGPGSTRKVYNGWVIPAEDVGSLKQKELKRVIDMLQTTGTPLTKKQFIDMVGGREGVDAKWSVYLELLRENKIQGNINYDGSIYDADGNYDISKIDTNIQSENPDYNSQANYYDLMTSSTGEQANDYRNAMFGSIKTQEQEVDQTLASAEMDAYKMLGQQQLQLERQIADQRMNQIRSGTTSAQLAAMELQNMFAGQSSAATIAQGVMENKVANKTQFAQQRAAVEPSLYEMLNANKTALATVEAQRFAAQKGYESYSPYYQMKAFEGNTQEYQKYLSTINNKG